MTTETVPPQENGVLEGTATELVTVQQAPPPSLFGAAEPAEVLVKATAVADALADVIQRKRLFVRVQGKSHVLVEGWTLLGSMLGVTALCTHTEPIDGGFLATVEARTADGRVIGRADALCTKHEKRGPWKSADDYARLSMAQTRATSKALKGPLGFVVSLAGYQATPAEEMTFAEQTQPAVEQHPDMASPAALKAIRAALKGKKVAQIRMLLVAAGVEEVADVKAAVADLTANRAHALIETLEQAEGKQA